MSVTANDVATTTITVTVRTPGGAPMAGQLVSLAANGAGNTVSQQGGPPDAVGQASGTLRSTVAEIKTITVTVNPGASQVVLTSQPQVTFTAGAPNAAQSTVAVSPASLTANGSA